MISGMNEFSSIPLEADPRITEIIFSSIAELQFAVTEEMHRYLAEIVHANLQPILAEQLGVPAEDFVVSVVSEGGSKYVAEIQIVGASLSRLREQLSDFSQRSQLLPKIAEVARTLRARLTTFFSSMANSNAETRFSLGRTDMGEPADFRIEQHFSLHFPVEQSSAVQVAARSAIARVSLRHVQDQQRERRNAMELRAYEALLNNTTSLETVLKGKGGQSISVLSIAPQAIADTEDAFMTIRPELSAAPVGRDVLSDIASWVHQTLSDPRLDVWVNPPSQLSRLMWTARRPGVHPSEHQDSVVFTVSLTR